MIQRLLPYVGRRHCSGLKNKGLPACLGQVKCYVWLINLGTHLLDPTSSKKELKTLFYSGADDGNT